MSKIKVKVERKTLLIDGPGAKDQMVFPKDFPVQLLHKLAALFDESGVERWDWQSMVMHLAFKHEPEFQIEVENPEYKRKTKKTDWNAMRLARLWLDVNALTQGKLLTIDRACTKLSKQPQWEGVSPTRQRYYESKNSPFVELFINTERKQGRSAMLDMANAIDWKKVLRDLDKMEETSVRQGD